MEQQNKRASGDLRPLFTVEDICQRHNQSRRYITGKFKHGCIRGIATQTRKIPNSDLESACDWNVTAAEFRRLETEGLTQRVCSPEDNGVIRVLRGSRKTSARKAVAV